MISLPSALATTQIAFLTINIKSIPVSSKVTFQCFDAPWNVFFNIVLINDDKLKDGSCQIWPISGPILTARIYLS